MPILADIITALSGIAADEVYPDAAPEGTPLPFVIVRRTGYEPVMTLQGPEGTILSTYIFESWAADKETAINLSDSVAAAIESSLALPSKFREPASGDEYVSGPDEFVEPVQYGFWHT